MKFRRIFGVILRNTYTLKYNYEEIADLIFWPSMDILLWGITAYFIKSLNPNFGSILFAIIAGLVFWHITWRNQYEMNINLLKELWNDNLINLFSTPLRFSEWILSHLIFGFVKMAIGFIFGIFLVYILYSVNIFSLGFYILPFMGLLMLSGWWIGFLMVGVIMRYGQRVQILAWAFATMLSPFSAIFYPVSVLPGWAQKISMIIPMSYTFEGIREVISTGNFDVEKVLISLILNLFYIFLAVLWLNSSYKKILKKGLIKAN